MKILDKYIIKKFLGTFFFSILLIITVAIIFDISEKLDDFLEKKVSIGTIIFKYYINFAPYYANLFMFLFIFIAVIFFTSKMASRSEIIAILSSGISFRRLMFPYFLSALVLAILSFLLSSFIIPPANKVRLDFENTYINGTYYNEDRNIHKQVLPGVYIYMESYNTTSDIGYRFSIEKFDENKQLVSKLISDYAEWDSIKQKWKVHNYYMRNIEKKKEVISRGRELDTFLSIKPDDFKRRMTMVETLNMFQLNAFIEEQKLHGADNIEAIMIEKYRRISFPFSTFILTLIGVCVASRKSRGGTGMHIGLGLSISATYILFMQISSQFAINGNMPPILAVWLPNIVFLIIGIILYSRASK